MKCTLTESICICSIHVIKGAPVDVGMSIDIASIDMVSEVNMVSSQYNYFLLATHVPRAGFFENVRT